MTDKFNSAIQEIAVKHGVVLSKDDPILILQTMNERLLEETRRSQQNMLLQLKEEMENISSQWKIDAKAKAENILNAALAGTKDAMARLLRESTNESAQTMKKIISDLLTEARQLTKQTQRFSWIVLAGLAGVFVGSLLFMSFILIHAYT